MLTPDDERLIAEKSRIIGVLYLSFTAAIVILGALPLSGALQASGKGLAFPLPYVFLGIAVLNFGLSQVIPKIICPKVSAGAPHNTAAVLQKFFTGVLVACVLRESAAILGFVAFFLTGDVQWSIAGCVIALAAMLLSWPKVETIRQIFN